MKYKRYIIFCYSRYDNVSPFDNADFTTDDHDEAVNKFNDGLEQSESDWRALFDCDLREVVMLHEPIE